MCSAPWLRLRVGLFDSGATQKIINADTVEICQLVQNSHRCIYLPQLIVGVGCLMDLKIVSKIFLLQILIFPQITQTILVHIITPKYYAFLKRYCRSQENFSTVL